MRNASYSNSYFREAAPNTQKRRLHSPLKNGVIVDVDATSNPPPTPNPSCKEVAHVGKVTPPFFFLLPRMMVLHKKWVFTHASLDVLVHSLLGVLCCCLKRNPPSSGVQAPKSKWNALEALNAVVSCWSRVLGSGASTSSTLCGL